MDKFKNGEKVIVLTDQTGHNTPIGTILTIKEIYYNEENENGEIYVIENNKVYWNKDLGKINKTYKEENFIIIDPSIILPEIKYKEIAKKYKNEEKEEINFPFKTKMWNTKEEIIIHKIEKTPYGGNGEYYTDEQAIHCISGLLCIAEKPSNWSQQATGLRYKTLKDSKDIFENILNKF